MNDDGFIEFLDTHRHDLARISRATRGEASPEDVQAEAWLLIADLIGKGHRIDLWDAQHRQLILARLYQSLVRYTELNVRYAVRLDHGSEEGEAHPLSHVLAANEMYDPEKALLHFQEQARLNEQTNLNPQLSLASAYLYLLDHLDNRMSAMAEHLRISLSYCYRRCAHARTWAAHQQGLPAAAMGSDPTFIPGAWRRFRLQLPHIQLSFDFDWGDRLFAEPQ